MKLTKADADELLSRCEKPMYNDAGASLGGYLAVRQGRGILLQMPWPPSVNHYYRTVRGRPIISKEGRGYRKAVETILFLAKLQPVEGRLAVEIDAYPPDARARDLDNITKCLLDALQHGGAFLNDSAIDDLHLRRMPADGEGRVVVRVQPYERGRR